MQCKAKIIRKRTIYYCLREEGHDGPHHTQLDAMTEVDRLQARIEELEADCDELRSRLVAAEAAIDYRDKFIEGSDRGRDGL